MDSLRIICPNGHLGFAPLRVESFRLGVAAASTGPWQRLNCTQTRIGAHDSVEFTLPGRIPPDIEPGRHKLTWMAVLSDGEAAIADMGTDGTAVTITR